MTLKDEKKICLVLHQLANLGDLMIYGETKYVNLI